MCNTQAGRTQHMKMYPTMQCVSFDLQIPSMKMKPVMLASNLFSCLTFTQTFKINIDPSPKIKHARRQHTFNIAHTQMQYTIYCIMSSSQYVVSLAFNSAHSRTNNRDWRMSIQHILKGYEHIYTLNRNKVNQSALI